MANMLKAAGAVSFSIADESTKIELRIAHGNNPTSQDDFKSFQTTIANFEPGHQCRSVPTSEDAVPGSNATLQLEYWNDSEKKEKYYACADIVSHSTKSFYRCVSNEHRPLWKRLFSRAPFPASMLLLKSLLQQVQSHPAAASPPPRRLVSPLVWSSVLS